MNAFQGSYTVKYTVYTLCKRLKETMRSLLLEINLLHRRKYIIIHLILSLL